MNSRPPMPRRRPRADARRGPTQRLLGAVALAAALAGCAAPVSRMPEPPPEATSVGMRPARVVFDEARDPRTVARNFVAIVEAVEPVAERECRNRAPQLNCDFRIVVDDRPGMPPNAFQTVDAAGRPIIAITLSLIADVRNADELAFVMGHEAAHHVAGHLGRQRQNATLGATVFGQLAGSIGGANPDSVRVAQELGAAVGVRTFSKEFELEADALGTIIAARAGFDPVRGSDYFLRIPDPGHRFLGTHPPSAERRALVRRTAAQLGL